MTRGHWIAFALAAACAKEHASSSPPPPAPAPAKAEEPEVYDPYAFASIHHDFSDAPRWSKQFDAPERDEWQKPELVLAKLKLKKNAVIADIGAGTGYFALRLARAVPKGKVFAVDSEPAMVKYVGERAQKEGVSNVVPVHSREDNPSLSDPVDVAFVCNTVHHLQDRPMYFAKLRERLRPGGRIVIVDFKPEAPDDAPGPPKRHRLAVQTLDVEMDAADLERVSEDQSSLPYQYIVEYRAKR